MLEKMNKPHVIITILSIVTALSTASLSVYYYTLLNKAKITKVIVTYDKDYAKNISIRGPSVQYRSYDVIGSQSNTSSNDGVNISMEVEYISTADTEIYIIEKDQVTQTISVQPGETKRSHYESPNR